MKTMRYLAASLLLITGVLHIVPIFRATHSPDSIPMLIFGVIFFAIGILLLLNLPFSPALGVIFPLIGLGIGFFKIGISNWDTMLSLMFIIDAIVLVCCAVLMLNRRKQTVA